MSRPKLPAVLCPLLVLAGCLLPHAALCGPRPIAIVIHGGAGVIEPARMSPEKAASFRAGLGAALDAGYAVLEKGGSSLDAVTAAVRLMEDDPQFNAGRGAVLNHEGFAELDAAIMDGGAGRAGAVAGVRHVKNPVELARLVMEKSPHVLLVGDGAEEFALEQGVVLVPRSYFLTPQREQELEQARHAPQSASAAATPREQLGGTGQHGHGRRGGARSRRESGRGDLDRRADQQDAGPGGRLAHHRRRHLCQQ